MLLPHRTDKRGYVTYQRDGVDVVRDMGQRVEVLQQNPQNIEVALRLAQEKFGNPLKLYGSLEFQEKVVRVAADAGLKVQFTDLRLNRLYQEWQREVEKPVPVAGVMGFDSHLLESVQRAFKSHALGREVRAYGYKDSSEKWLAFPALLRQEIEAYIALSKEDRPAALVLQGERLSSDPQALELLKQQIAHTTEKGR